MLPYPLEVYDGSKIQTQGHLTFIGRASVLVPAYRPNFAPYKRHFDKLSDTVLHIPAVVLRDQNYVVIATKDKRHSLNMYMFPNASDAEVMEYIEKYEGWTKEINEAIKRSLTFKNVRDDLDRKLYTWEEILPRRKITHAETLKIIEDELAELPFQYDVDFVESIANHTKETFGLCSIRKRSGWFSRPHHMHLQFRKRKDSKLYLYIVLHEIAHAVDFYVYRAFSHGPTFMHTYAKLIEKYMGFDPLGSMYSHGLVVRK